MADSRAEKSVTRNQLGRRKRKRERERERERESQHKKLMIKNYNRKR